MEPESPAAQLFSQCIVNYTTEPATLRSPLPALTPTPLLALSPFIFLSFSLHCYLTRSPLCSPSLPMAIRFGINSISIRQFRE